ncbi:DNA replication regulator SLD3-domain-containing protein [Entophlyctis helioformis]|nr:DNA replication regulator SLD3-domain-containing protein [Entophlyctis helioformis]
MLELGPSAVNQLRVVIMDQISSASISLAATADGSERHVPCFRQIMTACRQLLAQAPWNSGPVAPIQSPLKPTTTKMVNSRGLIRVRSHLFVLASVPANANELKRALDLTSGVPALAHLHGAGSLGSMDSETTSAGRILPLLPLVHDELISSDIWEDFVRQRVSLSWIHDDLAGLQDADYHGEAQLIRTAMFAVMRSLGGMLMSTRELLMDRRWMPLQDSLRLLHLRTVDPSFARTLLGKQTPTSLMQSYERTAALAGTRSFQCLHKAKLQLSPDMAIVDSGQIVETVLLQVSSMPSASSQSMRSSTSPPSSPFNPANRAMRAERLVNLRHLTSSMFQTEAFSCTRRLRIPITASSSAESRRSSRLSTATTSRSPQPTINLAAVPLDFEALVGHLVAMQSGLVVSLDYDDGHGNQVPAQSPVDDNPFAIHDETVAAKINDKSTASSSSRHFEARLGVLVPLLPSLLMLHIVQHGCESRLEQQPATVESDVVMADAQLSRVVAAWTASRLADPLGSFLAQGIWTPSNTDELRQLLFGLWSPATCRFLASPARTQTRDLCQDVSSNIEPDGASTMPEVWVESPTSTDDILGKLATCYLDVVYDKISLATFVGDILPQAYAALSDFLDANKQEGVEATQVLLSFYETRLLVSIQSLEARHLKLPQTLAALHAENARAADQDQTHVDTHGPEHALGVHEMAASRVWIQRIRTDLAKDGQHSAAAIKAEIRRKGRQLRTKEALLQLTLWMECLRIHTETGCDLPGIALDDPSKAASKSNPASKAKDKSNSKSKSKKLKSDNAGLDSGMSRAQGSKAGFETAIASLMDRVCIWSAVGGLELEGDVQQTDQEAEEGKGSWLWREFVSPIAIMFYEENIPHVVDALKVKAGGDPAVDQSQNAAKATPGHSFFKPRDAKKSKAAAAIDRLAGARLADRLEAAAREASDPFKLGSTEIDSTSNGHVSSNRDRAVLSNTNQQPPTKTRSALLDMSRRQVAVGPNRAPKSSRSSASSARSTAAKSKTASATTLTKDGTKPQPPPADMAAAKSTVARSFVKAASTSSVVQKSKVTLHEFLGPTPVASTAPAVMQAGLSSLRRGASMTAVSAAGGAADGNSGNAVVLVPVTPHAQRIADMVGDANDPQPDARGRGSDGDHEQIVIPATPRTPQESRGSGRKRMRDASPGGPIPRSRRLGFDDDSDDDRNDDRLSVQLGGQGVALDNMLASPTAMRSGRRLLPSQPAAQTGRPPRAPLRLPRQPAAGSLLRRLESVAGGQTCD